MTDQGTAKSKDMRDFPGYLFLLYVISYGVQAVYCTYLNLFLKGEGLDESEIGFIISVSAAAALSGQLLWGFLSDRAKVKNHVLLFLYIGAAIAGTCFYGGSGFIFFLLISILFTVLYDPTLTLQDNLALEILESGRYDFGKIRMGGTAGYCLAVLAAGYFLRDDYRKIFFLISGSLVICAIIMYGLKPVYGQGGNTVKKAGLKDFALLWDSVVSNRRLAAVIGLQLIFRIGNVYFSGFYPIYMTGIGGNSSTVGVIMFACALSEIPVYYIIHWMMERFGEDRVLVGAGVVTALRWLALARLHSMPFILLANLFHGIGFAVFTYSVLQEINISVPRSLRATGQMMNAVFVSLTSKVLFGYLNGLASERIGIPWMLQGYGMMMLAATGFYIAYTIHRRKRGIGNVQNLHKNKKTDEIL